MNTISLMKPIEHIKSTIHSYEGTMIFTPNVILSLIKRHRNNDVKKNETV